MLISDEHDGGPSYGSKSSWKNDDVRGRLRQGRNFKKPIIIIISLVVLSVGSYTILPFLKYGGEEEIAQEEAAQENKKENEKKIFAELDKLESSEDEVALIKYLYKNSTKEHSKVFLKWLEQREDEGFPPYLYATARNYLIEGDAYQALLYYSAAGLMARIDAARCTDRTTASWVAFLENSFVGVHDYMKEHPTSKLAAGKWALLKEESSKRRKLPSWICKNGENPMKYVAYKPEELWQLEREEIRRAFKEFTESKPEEENLAAVDEKD